jgi:zinc D-Ala-D-Ala carboxypeptidase
MKLSAHFSLAEFTDSDTARRLGIDNSLPDELLGEAMNTAAMMERIRLFLSERSGRDIGLLPSSGYRSLALNRAIGSKDSSDHVKMMAVDFRAPAFGTPFDVCQALVPVVDALHIGQLIFEHTWIHVSTRQPDKQLNRILTVQGGGYVCGVVGP